MSIVFSGLLRGNIDAITIAKTIKAVYGGSEFAVHLTSSEGFYQIIFHENLSEEALAMKPWRRRPLMKFRCLSVNTDGSCAGDYEDITTEPMTIVSLGHSSDAPVIITALVAHFGGYINDDMNDLGWTKYEEAVQA
jgi:hypothetical protein